MAGFGYLLLASAIILQFNLITAQTYVYHLCSVPYASNTTYDTNLNLLLSSISNTTARNNTRFYTNSVGSEPDRVFGILQCRGDLSPQACKECANTATNDIKYRCPYNKELIIWYVECSLRYSNNNIIGTPTVVTDLKNCWSFENVLIDPLPFNSKVEELMRRLVKQAASSRDMFAVGVADETSLPRIYGLVQCTQDINLEGCERCINTSISEISTCLGGRNGGRILRPSCIIWFEVYKFFQSNDSIFTDIPTEKENNSSETVAIIAISVVLGVVSLSVFTILFWLKKRKRPSSKYADVNDIPTVESLDFNFGKVSAATSNFNEANKLGEGGFGVVYKGNLSDGRIIAVKRLSENSGQGVEEFKNEVLLLVTLQHKNLVKLLGFSVQGDEKLLIYEYVPNGSLDSLLFDENKRGALDWDRRYKIIGGIARGLLYLHEDSRDRIIHRDLKGSNVLIDEQMLPKISDFGMARLVKVDQTQGTTSKIVGTYGYMAPEYAVHGQFSVKSDVFSFGVIVLEIITGLKSTHFYRVGRAQDFLFYVSRHWQEGTAEELIDQTVQEYPASEVMRCLQIGLLCVQENVGRRPTMTAVVLMLSNYSFDLPLPSTPGVFAETTGEFDMVREGNEMQTVPTSQSSVAIAGNTSTSRRSIDDESISILHPR